MKKTDYKVEEFIRVDHAGERGAIKIYEGQLLALNTLIKDENLKKIIEEMKIHEMEHCQFFENEIKKRNIKPNNILILVRDNPKILNVTSLQLIVFSCNCFNNSSLEIMSVAFFSPQTVDSSKKPCSIPK